MIADNDAVALMRQMQDRMEYLLKCCLDNQEPDLRHIAPVLASAGAEIPVAEAKWLYQAWIGKTIRSRSDERLRLPSGHHHAIVRDIVFNEASGKAAFSLEGIDQPVDCHQVTLVSHDHEPASPNL